jgi:hypothetical protein
LSAIAAIPSTPARHGRSEAGIDRVIGEVWTYGCA